MSEENKVEGKCCKKGGVASAQCGGAYGLGFIAAAVYYIQHAGSFWAGVVGILKALVWPAFLVYKAMEFFKM
jgi:hypothetical protein